MKICERERNLKQTSLSITARYSKVSWANPPSQKKTSSWRVCYLKSTIISAPKLYRSFCTFLLGHKQESQLSPIQPFKEAHKSYSHRWGEQCQPTEDKKRQSGVLHLSISSPLNFTLNLPKGFCPLVDFWLLCWAHRQVRSIYPCSAIPFSHLHGIPCCQWLGSTMLLHLLCAKLVIIYIYSSVSQVETETCL